MDQKINLLVRAYICIYVNKHVLLLVDVSDDAVKVGWEVPELERGVDHGPDGVHLVAADALDPVGADLHVDAAEVVLVHPPAHAVRGLQDQQVTDAGVPQPLSRRDSCI
jgi:hypothetical protein